MGDLIDGDSDENLVRRSRSGDAAAVGALLSKHLPDIYAFLRIRMSPELKLRESTSDLVQSVCREVLADIGDFEYRGEQSFRRWLFLAAERKLADRGRFYARQKRAGAREVAIEDHDLLATGYKRFSAPDQRAMQKEDIERLEKALDHLPHELREVLTYARYLGMSRREIGERMGKTESAVRTMLHRAAVRLELLLASEL